MSQQRISQAAIVLKYAPELAAGNAGGICEPSSDLPGLISMMKNLLLPLALFAAAVAAPQAASAAEVVRGPRGTAMHTGGGTAVHTDHNWDDAYWHTNRYGYWHGQRGYWTVRGGKHVFVVVH